MLVVWKLDRLGRFYLHILATFAEFERELILERTKAKMGGEAAWQAYWPPSEADSSTDLSCVGAAKVAQGNASACRSIVRS